MKNKTAKADSTGIIIIESEYDRLVEEILELEYKLAALAEEIDDLENHVCRELRAEYDLKIGNLEYQATALQLEIAKLKRAIELLQAAINRQETAKYEDINKQIEEEYQKYEDDLNKKAEEMEHDREYHQRRAKQDEKNEERAKEERKKTDESDTFDSDAKKYKSGTSPSEELKHLYREIVKKLHPDANPDASDKELELFRRASRAYAEGNIEELREIAQQLDDKNLLEMYSDTPEDISKLRELKDRLEEKVELLMKHIDDIKNDFPYNIRDFLADNDAIARKQDELNEYIRLYSEKIIELQNRILELSKIAERNQKEEEARHARKGRKGSKCKL